MSGIGRRDPSGCAHSYERRVKRAIVALQGHPGSTLREIAAYAQQRWPDCDSLGLFTALKRLRKSGSVLQVKCWFKLAPTDLARELDRVRQSASSASATTPTPDPPSPSATKSVPRLKADFKPAARQKPKGSFHVLALQHRLGQKNGKEPKTSSRNGDNKKVKRLKNHSGAQKVGRQKKNGKARRSAVSTKVFHASANSH